jgi:hypothetical protein
MEKSLYFIRPVFICILTLNVILQSLKKLEYMGKIFFEPC